MSFPQPDESSGLLLTRELLISAKDGDRAALDRLMSRYLPRLNRWASGRLPLYARSLFDTSDLVHETMLRAIQGLDGIEVRGAGGFQAYMRHAILNRIRDQVRWARRRSGSKEITEDFADATPSPLDDAVSSDFLDRYERAQSQLSEEERLLLHLRLELDFSYDEIAAMTDRPSGDAVRKGVRRSIRKLAEVMSDER